MMETATLTHHLLRCSTCGTDGVMLYQFDNAGRTSLFRCAGCVREEHLPSLLVVCQECSMTKRARLFHRIDREAVALAEGLMPRVVGVCRTCAKTSRAPKAAEDGICPRCRTRTFRGHDGPACPSCGWQGYENRSIR